MRGALHSTLIHSREDDNLARFRWHTGAEPRPLHPDEIPPVLFRDIGSVGMEHLLDNRLQRLAGPMTPITYMRTADYQEPYIDHGGIGRLVVLSPVEMCPWYSGVRNIYIASARRVPSATMFGFVPSSIPLSEAVSLLAGVKNREQLREVFGGHEYGALQKDTLARTRELNREHAQSEQFARPLRILFQTGNREAKAEIRRRLEQEGLTETDLCIAWHHLPFERRRHMINVLPGMGATS